MKLRATLLAVAAAALLVPSCDTSGGYWREDGTLDAKALYRRRCSQCHALFDPRRFSDAEWVAKVNRYGPRAGVPPELRPDLVAWLQQTNDR